MKKISFLFLVTVLGLAFLSSCVPSRKYEALQTEKTNLAKRYADSTRSLKDLRSDYAKEHQSNAKISKELNDTKRDMEKLQMSYDQTMKLNKDLQELYEKVIAQNKNLTDKAAGDVQALSESQQQLKLKLERKEMELDRLSKDMDDRKKKMDDLEKSIKEREANIEGLKGDKSQLEKNLADRENKVKTLENDLADREKRVKELEALLNAQKEKSAELQNKLKNALTGFTSDELTISEQDGKVYISLSQKLLFATGSKVIDKKGKDALAKLAEVLKKNNVPNITVEGHTDSDGDENANWDLSVGRATSVLFELTKSGVNPAFITAAGRGEHHPKASNTNADGKAQNRRTEIILSPDLTELFQIINQ